MILDLSLERQVQDYHRYQLQDCDDDHFVYALRPFRQIPTNITARRPALIILPALVGAIQHAPHVVTEHVVMQEDVFREHDFLVIENGVLLLRGCVLEVHVLRVRQDINLLVQDLRNRQVPDEHFWTLLSDLLDDRADVFRLKCIDRVVDLRGNLPVVPLETDRNAEVI